MKMPSSMVPTPWTLWWMMRLRSELCLALFRSRWRRPRSSTGQSKKRRHGRPHVPLITKAQAQRIPLEPLSSDAFSTWLSSPLDWWKTERGLPRVVMTKPPFRTKRLKALGNGQVSRCASTAWRILKWRDEGNTTG